MIKVGVVRGGPSPEYDVSLETGKSVIDSLGGNFGIIDIFIDREGVWHIGGVPKKPEEIFPHVDVFFNALHGAFGEDGGIQEIFDTHKVKYTGPRKLGAGMSMRKDLAKEIVRSNGIAVPWGTRINRGDSV